MTVVMKIDLVGPRRRGLALGLNESAGYGGVALAAGLSGLLASQFAARDVIVVGGAIIAVTAFLLSVLFVRDTAAHVALEQSRHDAGADAKPPRLREAFARATLTRAGASLLLTGGASQQPQRRARVGAGAAVPRRARRQRRAGRARRRRLPRRLERRADRHRPLVRHGRTQAADRRRHAAPGAQRWRCSRSATATVAIATGAAVLLGLGTALVYPTLIAAISDAVTPVARAPIVGVYRFWRDIGYVFGSLIAGGVADALGYGGAIDIVAALTAASGLWVLYDLPTHHPSASAMPERRRSPSLESARAREKPAA